MKFNKWTLGLAAIAALALTGCKSVIQANKPQIIQSVSGDGVQGKIAVPITQTTSIGASLFVGRFNVTTIAQPTATSSNGVVNAPNLAVVVAGAGKQAVNGSTGVSTNSSAGITDGSRDVSIIVTGQTTASGTNGSVTITGGK